LHIVTKIQIYYYNEIILHVYYPSFFSVYLTTNSPRWSSRHSGRQKENKTFGGSVSEAAAYWLMDQSLLTRAILVRNPLLILTQPQTYALKNTRTPWYLNFFRFFPRRLFNKFSILTDCEWNKVVRQSSVLFEIGRRVMMYVYKMEECGIYGGAKVRAGLLRFWLL